MCHEQLSSLPLEVLLFFNKHYVVLYSVINVCLYIYKCERQLSVCLTSTQRTLTTPTLAVGC